MLSNKTFLLMLLKTFPASTKITACFFFRLKISHGVNDNLATWFLTSRHLIATSRLILILFKQYWHPKKNRTQICFHKHIDSIEYFWTISSHKGRAVGVAKLTTHNFKKMKSQKTSGCATASVHWMKIP